MSVPATMIYFTLYDQLKIIYGFKPGEKNVFSPMLAGVSARGKIKKEQHFWSSLNWCEICSNPERWYFSVTS